MSNTTLISLLIRENLNPIRNYMQRSYWTMQ